MSSVTLMQGDCLERMKEIDAGSVDMVLVDPPYGTMAEADLGKHSTDWDVQIETGSMFEAVNGVLRMNGAMCMFGAEPFTSKAITSAHGNIPFSYRMVWLKDQPAFSMYVGCKKRPMSLYEDVCVFFKKYDTLGQHPVRDWFYAEFVRLGLTRAEYRQILGNDMAGHYFTKGVQFALPTEANYRKLQTTGGFQRDYHELKREDEAFKRKFPATFNLPPGQKYKSNILEYRKDYSGHHPTQKPVALLEDLIETYTNEGDTVLDFTMGSGSTGVACVNTGRHFIGIELDAEYYAIAEQRINAAQRDKDAESLEVSKLRIEESSGLTLKPVKRKLRKRVKGA